MYGFKSVYRMWCIVSLNPAQNSYFFLEKWLF